MQKVLPAGGKQGERAGLFELPDFLDKIYIRGGLDYHARLFEIIDAEIRLFAEDPDFAFGFQSEPRRGYICDTAVFKHNSGIANILVSGSITPIPPGALNAGRAVARLLIPRRVTTKAAGWFRRGGLASRPTRAPSGHAPGTQRPASPHVSNEVLAHWLLCRKCDARSHPFIVAELGADADAFLLLRRARREGSRADQPAYQGRARGRQRLAVLSSAACVTRAACCKRRPRRGPRQWPLFRALQPTVRRPVSAAGLLVPSRSWVITSASLANRQAYPPSWGCLSATHWSGILPRLGRYFRFMGLSKWGGCDVGKSGCCNRRAG